MTMRSMPPASSHFAERPVPGAAADDRLAASDHAAEAVEDLARAGRAARLSLRRPAGRPDRSDAISPKCATRASANAGSLMLWGRRTRRRFAPARKPRRDGVEQRLVGGGIPERLARRVDPRDAALRDQEPHRPLHPVQLVHDELADGRALVRRGAHQGDVLVVAVESCGRETAPAPCPWPRSSPCRARRTSRRTAPARGRSRRAARARRRARRRRSGRRSRSSSRRCTPARRPESTSFSIDCPPVPVAWKTRQS